MAVMGDRRMSHAGRRARNYRMFCGAACAAAAPRRRLTNPGRIWNTGARRGERACAAPSGDAMETLAFILHNLPAIGERTLEHVSIVSVAVGVAIVTGVPLGIAITQSQRTADTVLYLGSIVMTIPSIALFGVLIPILSKIGQGIGWLPAVIAAMLYAQLPIIRNTYTAIRNVDPALRSAAIGMGMSVPQRLARVEIPIALPVIIAGVRIAVVINIGVTAIAAYIGAGGLGTFISPRHLAIRHPPAHHRRADARAARDRGRLRRCCGCSGG